MPKFIVQEIKEIIVESVVVGHTADEVIMKYKNRTRRDVLGVQITKVSEESHITSEQQKEEK